MAEEISTNSTQNPGEVEVNSISEVAAITVNAAPDAAPPTTETSEPDTKDDASKPIHVENEMDEEPEMETELEKYWRAVKDNPHDFTGWTYLLQYVEQENNLPGARTAFEAFLLKYPYCYGYWKKYADMEKRNENFDKTEEVFEKGVASIALSIELWIHYLNFVINRADAADGQEDRVRKIFEQAVTAAGTSFKADKLWDMYLLWEKDGKNLRNITKIYDRLLAVPTQLYSHHFEQFCDHIKNNHPKDCLSVDEFLQLRKEVLKETIPTMTVEDVDVAPPGEDGPPGVDDKPPGDDAPPGEESMSTDAKASASEDKEMAALREKVIEARKKLYLVTEREVGHRWSFEEGIRRPYFHVKPLEKSQLKNWREYLDYEIEHGTPERVRVLYERCVIACALYEEFWLKYTGYLEQKEHPTDEVRNVFKRACNIHLPTKPNLHLAWAAFEERNGNLVEAVKVLDGIEVNVAGLAMVALRRISLERRQGNFQQTENLYQAAVTSAKKQDVKSFYTIKYARYLAKVVSDLPRAKEVLQEAVKEDEGNVKLYLQLVDLEYQQHNVNEVELLQLFDQAIKSPLPIEHRVAFSQRKLEYLEDFGSRVDRLVDTYDEHQKLVKEYQSVAKKRKPEAEEEAPEAKKSKVETPNGTAEATPVATNGVGDAAQPISTTTEQQPPASTAPPATTTSTYSYNQWPGYGNHNAYSGYSQAGWGGYGSYY